MKKIIIAAFAACMAFAASAQTDIFDNPTNEARLGARVSVDITSTSDGNDFYSNGAGFSVGTVYNIPVYKNLYVEPGLSVFYNTFGIEVEAGAPGVSFGVIDGSIRNWGFRVPIVAGYFFDFTDDVRIAPFTGPQMNLSFSATEGLDGGKYESIFGEGGFKHVDLQWVFGVGASYQNYYLSISGAIGMTRARDLKLDHFSRNTVSIALGYNF